MIRNENDDVRESQSGESGTTVTNYQHPAQNPGTNNPPIQALDYLPQQFQSHQQTAQSNGNINIFVHNKYNDNRVLNQHQTNVVICSESESGNRLNFQEDPDASSECQDEIVIKKFWQLQDSNREMDIMLQNTSGVEHDDIPVVHPTIYKVLFYEGALVRANEYQPTSSEITNVTREFEIKFENLLAENAELRYLCLIGIPGIGKTTCAKRLAKTDKYKVCLHLKFMDMNYEDDEKLTLRELLLDNAFPDLSVEECEQIFEWIKSNQSKCVIIMDGFDQAEWSLNKVPSRKRYEVPQSITDIIASLFSKFFLSHVRLVVTSRPHAIMSLPNELRPDAVYLLQDLSLVDMKTLFYSMAGTESDRLWNELHTKAPQLVSMCQCPLILLLYIRSALNPSENIGEVTTMTRIFATVFENLRRSDNARHEDINVIQSQLARLAYNATKKGTVLITSKELKEENLTSSDVQDLVVTVQGYQGRTCKVFEGDHNLYFSHQSFQEYLCAVHICSEMPLEEFERFIKNGLSDHKWSVVRRFLFGLLADIIPSEGVFLVKKDMLVKNYVCFESEFVVQVYMENFADICSCVRECNREELVDKVANFFPMRMDIHASLTASDFHAVANVLKKVKKQLESLRLAGGDPSSHAFAHIASAIKEMPGSFNKLTISENHLHGNALDMIVDILPKVNELLWLHDCFSDGEIGQRHLNLEERAVLQRALNDIDDTNLCVEVSGYTFGAELIFPLRS